MWDDWEAHKQGRASSGCIWLALEMGDVASATGCMGVGCGPQVKPVGVL